MMDPMMKMKLKQKLLQELMEENDSMQGQKLKPKMAAIEVTKVDPKPEMMHEKSMLSPDKAKDDELNDDDLKKLLHHYMS